MASASSWSCPFLCKYLQPLSILFIFYLNLLCFQHIKATSNETDYLALLKFKESISDDPEEIMSSWNSSSHFCIWTGITCSPKDQRVIELNLGGHNLRGTISPHVGNLSFLRNLYLPKNNFYGEIPPELGRLYRLKLLSLTNNTLTGEIPWNLTSCTELRHLNLSWNSLGGKIPLQLGSLKKLERLVINDNNLTGKIPFSIWNLSSLVDLRLTYNQLEGRIPEEIGHLKSLRYFTAAANNLVGALPSSLFNMSSLIILSFTKNQLSGTLLPHNMFLNLPYLQLLDLGLNQISSPIPNSITNASSLQFFDIWTNYFVGAVPSLENLKDLRWLNLAYNNLGRSFDEDLNFIASLKNCSKLEILSLSYNKFGGHLPNSMGNLSTQLVKLYLGGNHIYGTIPDTLGKYTNLIALGLEANKFSGTIPTSFGNFPKLQLLAVYSNQISGGIPISLGNLTQLVILNMSQNLLEGKIPPIFGNMNNLQNLDLSENNFIGAIPLEIFSLSSLSISLSLSHNSLNGSLPAEVGKLINLGTLDISENKFSGEIPSTIGECSNMEYLNLQGNSFNGSMPSSLASLKGLTHLDMSRNNLSGPILTALQNLHFLQYLNVSFNMLDGEVPTKGVFNNASVISMIGNSKLCGGISVLQLPKCPIKVAPQRRHHNLKLVIIMVCMAFSIFLIFMFALCWWRQRSIKSSSTSPTIEQLSKVSYQDLHSATEGFSTNNLIGSGSFGLVYKGRLESEEKIVAIKVLNLLKRGADKSFISECNALKNIRHRNLVKVLTCCSSTDFKGQEFKALVFEFMSNGSLENWLHPNLESVDQCSILDLHQRFNIIQDVASALHYLHYECEQPIVHCDIKPSNVLLDDDMVAHVSDFGLARLLLTINGTSFMQTSTSGIKGTVGYAPPEYGIGSEVSIQGDVYSFGILVLEMLSGKPPIEEMFEDGYDLHSYVEASFPKNILEIIDSTLIPKQLYQTGTTTREQVDMHELVLLHPSDEKTVCSLLEIGLACSTKSPKERLNMIDVTRKLNQISTFHFGKRNVQSSQNKEWRIACQELS